MTRFTPIEGIRVRFRTLDDATGSWATCTVWIDDAPKLELGRLNRDVLTDPGDPSYQNWVECMGEVFNRWLARTTKVDGIRMKRRRPNYRGEGG